MTALFNRAGIRFQYPENWRLDDSDAVLGRDSVLVESPGGAFWSVTIDSLNADPVDMAAAALKAMQEEYEVEVEQIDETIDGYRLVGYDLNFFYLDLTSTAQIRAVRTPSATYLIHCQAEDREFDEIAPVLRAMTISLLRPVEFEE